MHASCWMGQRSAPKRRWHILPAGEAVRVKPQDDVNLALQTLHREDARQRVPPLRCDGRKRKGTSSEPSSLPYKSPPDFVPAFDLSFCVSPPGDVSCDLSVNVGVAGGRFSAYSTARASPTTSVPTHYSAQASPATCLLTYFSPISATRVETYFLATCGPLSKFWRFGGAVWSATSQGSQGCCENSRGIPRDTATTQKL